ncbi:Serpentine Receptor, class Z [Caenorhabditis elegans]|uniref:Serpentine Receptor, class Z n=1 Tax=Caenorhabditis elegans TaxID=6239 RepID=Q9XX69_CAEEL|nr:Serpentine Receptor, class Z [Caenorhabditis elegans]CAA20966.1 Serpentine Receptor, class Z [Caenorhabditis elegans]|eukprot:NP_507296.1 Serpentine Receptor, class Z [Caenorhabditis elegans]
MLAHDIQRINYYSNLKNFDLILIGLYGLLFFACIIIYTVVLPFYIYANKVNHERDKEILIYPITNHFYKMVIVYYLIFISTCFGVFFYPYLSDSIVLISFIIQGLYSSLNIITQVFHVLLFVLSVERGSLYFFPSSEKLFKSSQNIIKYLYFLIIVKEVSCDMFSAWKYQTVQNVYWINLFLCITCSINDVLVFISAILYIPIVISIRKFVNLQSAQNSKPHKYIFLQTMVVFTFKSIQVLVYLMTNHTGISLTSLFICAIRMSDYITTPLIVQLSYLSCNKRNMKLLLSSMSARKLLSCSERVPPCCHVHLQTTPHI